jgi:uncharacterized protein YacL
MFVDLLIRICGAAILGVAGGLIGRFMDEQIDGRGGEIWLWASIAGGLLLGFIAAPLVARPALRWVQAHAADSTPALILLGTGGLMAGLLAAALLAPALSQLPWLFGDIVPFIASVLLGGLGIAVAVSREDEFEQFLNRHFPQFRGRGRTGTTADVLLDTSVAIDGRISDVYATGFLRGRLLVPRFVLDELRHIADSPDATRRTRGRRGLDVLTRLQKSAGPQFEVVDTDYPDLTEVDAKLVRMARSAGVPLLTNDFNLNRVAELEGVTVLNLNLLANAVKTVVLPGEDLLVRVIQEGREQGQGVGFLEDGTMVVVEGGRRHMNEEVTTTVTRVLQTSAGRMVFAQLESVATRP